jgi:hypothetical protein
LKPYLTYLQSVKKIVPSLIVNKSFYQELINDFNESDYADFIQFCYDFKTSTENKTCLSHSCDNKRKFINFTSGYSKGCSQCCNYKINFLEKYGVEHNSQLDSVKEKKKETSLEKYGVENISQVNEIKQKKMNTAIKKYGVENISQVDEIKQKKMNTTNKNFGVDHYFELTDNMKIHYNNSFGVDSPLKNQQIKNKVMNTTKYRHGGIGFQLEKCQIAAEKTNIKIMYLKLIERKIKYVFLDSKEVSFDEFITNHEQNTIKVRCIDCEKIILFDLKEKTIFRRCEVCFPISELTSRFEVELSNKIKTTNIEKSNRKILNGKELDIYLPDKQLAIEFNGIYWHSELMGKDKKYHLGKTIECEKQGIQLIHIFENEWLEKQAIIISMINSKIGVFDKRIHGRKCMIKEISTKIKNEFLDNNHLQGQDKSSIKIGLFYDNELVSVMTFGKARYNKEYEYEMHRFCNKLGYQINGGASKLWVYFKRTFRPTSVITYADRRYSNGSFYEKIGFSKIRESAPNYFYFKNDEFQPPLLSRIQFQKHKLKDKLNIFDETQTEWENMQNNNYNRIWDCGNHVFEWKRLE